MREAKHYAHTLLVVYAVCAPTDYHGVWAMGGGAAAEGTTRTQWQVVGVEIVVVEVEVVLALSLTNVDAC